MTRANCFDVGILAVDMEFATYARKPSGKKWPLELENSALVARWINHFLISSAKNGT